MPGAHEPLVIPCIVQDGTEERPYEQYDNINIL